MRKGQTKRRKRTKLFRRQNGLCFYCGEPMVLIENPTNPAPENMATLEHLDDRWSPNRGKHPGKYRVVAACWKCNNERNAERLRNLPKEMIWEKCGHLDRMKEAKPTS